MEMNEYHDVAMKTGTKETDKEKRYTNAILGLCGEAGELADAYKKHLFHGHPFRQTETLYELGDVLWYIVMACDAMGYSLNDVAQMNMEKLQKRYPDGFSKEASINRSA